MTTFVWGDWEDIGSNVRIRRCHRDGVFYAIDYDHPCRDKAYSFVPVIAKGEKPNVDEWTIESEQPLTLSPSLLCRACGHHGWIRDGKWVDA